MTAHTKTITNTLNVLGGSPPTLWGVGKWGTMKWGVDGDLMITFLKVIQNSMSGSTTTIGKQIAKEISNATAITTDLSLTLTLDDLWTYIFAKATADAASQVVDAFSRTSDVSTTQTQSSDPTTTWTDA